MARPDLSRVPEYFHRYIDQVKEDNINDAFHNQADSFISFLNSIPDSKIDYSYAPGKWSVKEVLQHIIDAERVFAYRALCFARQDKSSLPSFDENEYAAHSKASHRNWQDLVDEFKTVRKGTEHLFNSFDNDQLNANGTASGKPNYVLGIGYVVAGHVTHHEKILREKYL
jgi:hypothetical protein